MADISCERRTSVEDYGVDMDQVYFRSGPLGRIGKSDQKEKEHLFNATDILEKIQCDHDNSHWQVTYTLHVLVVFVFYGPDCCITLTLTNASILLA